MFAMKEFIRNNWPHLFYCLLISGMLWFYAQKQAQWSAFSEATAQQLHICNRIIESDFQIQYYFREMDLCVAPR
jgi:hypothetical protein